MPMAISLTPIVIARIFGGLGNQLFSYAAARRLALVNNADLIIDDISGFARDYTYKRHYQLDHFDIPFRKATASERLEPLSRLRRALRRKLNSYRPFAMRDYIQQRGIDFEPRLLDLKLSGDVVYLEGYWQSEDYFKDVEGIIRQDLQFKPPTDAWNLAMAARIRGSNSVAVHVRFFDEPGMQGSNNAPSDYYTCAISKMERLACDAHYFIFSDKPVEARARIPLPATRFTLVSHNQGDAWAFADLWLMSLCQHFIIGNSTFSWWGAWLNPSQSKVVIAPGYESRDGVASWGFPRLLPAEWITC